MHTHVVARWRDESGVALVLAMGIALIGMAVATIVVSLVITASNDSGRDRTRTTEIHSAEGAIDATMAELSFSSPCPKPSFSPLTSGNGAQETTVVVTIAYFDDDGPVDCSGGVPEKFPNQAVITATSTSPNGVIGLPPVRTMEAKVTLNPRVRLGQNAAIFSEGSFNTDAAFDLAPSAGGGSPDIWVDSGSWSCGGGTSVVHLEGALYMPAGGLTVAGDNCRIDGDVWLQNGLTTSGTGGTQVFGGNLTVRSSGVTLSGDVRVAGNVLVGGAKGGSKEIVAGGTVNYGVGAAAIPDLVPAGIPEVNYVPGDWTDTTKVPVAFHLKDQDDFATLAGVSPCGTIKKSTPAVELSQDGPTVYNLTPCTGGLDINKMTMEINADTAIFANSVTITQSFNVISGDAQEHKLWIIVPYSTVTGSIKANATGVTIDPKISSFWYAPGSIDVNPSGSYRGQIYGGTVSIKNGNYFQYENVGVPGVQLVAGVTYENGYEVALVYKTEVS